jgi:hypothetical protein
MSTVLRQALLPLLLALVLLCALLYLDPFRLTSALAARLSGPVRQDAMVTNVYRNSATQEVTNGEAPLAGLSELASRWCDSPAAPRFVLIGNSQTYTILLAPSEPSTKATERTYLDQIIDHESAHGRPILGYRLSAPNLSYAEALWYLHFLLSRKCATPERVVIQLNYESFRKIGIRTGMLSLLAEPDFAHEIAAEANSQAVYAETFRQATEHYRELKERTRAASAPADAASKTGLNQSHGIGPQMESWVRGTLDEWPSFRARGTLKAELLTTLYLLRVNVLGITPTTKRSIGGFALAMSVSALERIGELCVQNHIKLEFFLAPENPRAVLYRTAADRRNYRMITEQLTRKYAWRSADLEDGIPGAMWGIWIDGPDPIHFGRAAHARMAQLMIGAGLVPDGS